MGDLSKNFSRREFACRCGCSFDDVNPDLVKKLQQLRDRIGRPLYINSGCRCPAHNAAVRGAKKSYHLRGMAADVHADMNPSVLAQEATAWFNGIIVHPWGVHLDIREGRKYWKL